ncbi:MAG: hypothetical protein H7Y38_04920 [Armatimonadetes bacterium]|nr:hypothetical protein [Armatimonadota bacterium]
MKKNNGSLQLWLWTITPFLCWFWAALFINSPELTRATHGDWFMQFVYPRAWFLYGALPILSIGVWNHLRKCESETLKPTALMISRAILLGGNVALIMDMCLRGIPHR